MQPRQFKKPALNPKIKKPTNFNPLLQDIRSKLGPDWWFYQEFLDGAIRATAREQDVSAWFEQIEPLVEGREDLAFSHQGVLFLLAEMGVKVHNDASSIDNMPPPPLPPSVVSPLQHLITTPPALKMQRNDHYRPDSMPLSPFEIDPYMSATPASAKTPQYPTTPNVPFSGAMNINHAAPSPLKQGVDPIFFTDPTFNRDVQRFFGVSTQDNDTKRHTTDDYSQSELIPPYNPRVDDVEIWRARTGNTDQVTDKSSEGVSNRDEQVAKP
ncbi:Nn.00g062680.m01.CDS01 [Neocucurbitaria sp. VM-36]